MKRLQTFFARQTPVARLIWAITVPLILFTFAYAMAVEQSGHGHPFDFSSSGIVWSFYVAVVGVFEYCVWQPPINS